MRKFALVIAFLCVSCSAYGQMRVANLTLPAYDMHVFEIDQGEPPLFVPQKPLDLKLHQYHLADGKYICAFPTGPPGEIVIDAYRNGEPGQMPVFVRLFAKIEGNAPPPDDPVDPDPPPPLTGLAKQIYESAVLANEPAVAKKIGMIYSSAASSIAAGGMKTLVDIRAFITNSMKTDVGKLNRSWEPTGNLIKRAMDEFAQTVPNAGDTTRAIGLGMEAAGR